MARAKSNKPVAKKSVAKKPVPPPVDPQAAVAPLFMWFAQSFRKIWELADEAGAVMQELRNPDSPWQDYVTSGISDFCQDLQSLVDDHLTPPFAGAFPSVNPAGLVPRV